MGNVKLILAASILTLVSVQAHAVPISYQFHGEVTKVNLSIPTDCSIDCVPAVTLGQTYSGFLLYDLDTITVHGDEFYGGVPSLCLIFNNFVVFSENLFVADGLATIDGAENDGLHYLDEFGPHGAGIYGSSDVVELSLFSDNPDAITSDNRFPVNLDDFSFGHLVMGTNF